eukprot:1162090-Pelagomonas_calceolata.AAC.18
MKCKPKECKKWNLRLSLSACNSIRKKKRSKGLPLSICKPPVMCSLHVYSRPAVCNKPGLINSPAGGREGGASPAPNLPSHFPPFAPLDGQDKGPSVGYQGGRNGVSRGPFLAEGSRFDKLAIQSTPTF